MMHLRDQRVDLIDFCVKNVGDGSLTSFWDDVCLGEVPLNTRFRRVFSLDLNKRATVQEMLGPYDWLCNLPMNLRGWG